MLGQPDLGMFPAPKPTSGIMEAACMAAGVVPALLTGMYAVRRRSDEIAASEREAAVKDAVGNAAAEAAAKLKAITAKAAKDKEIAVAREVKKAREETIKELQAKNNAGADGPGKGMRGKDVLSKTEENSR
jgi:acyl-coenzyme A synthetase/AMP-(fatty) acid ligase